MGYERLDGVSCGRGHWRSSLSLAFALRADSAVQEFDAPDWLVASTAEGLARAYAALGNEDARDEWISNAESLAEEIADDEDRALIASQLASIPLGPHVYHIM